MAMLALRRSTGVRRAGRRSRVTTFGDASACSCWAAPTPRRFQAGMGTAFLERIAEIASASLSRLLRLKQVRCSTSRAIGGSWAGGSIR